VRWLRDAAPITGATAPSYAVMPQDIGHELTCEVTAKDGTGGEAISCAIPGLKIEIGGYPYHAGINQATAINEFFDARANALSARLTTQQATSVHWGPAVQVYLSNSTGRIGILIGGFIGTTMYIFQIMGPVDDSRATDVIAHLMATFAPAG